MDRREMLAGVTTLAPCVLGVNVFPIKPYDPVAVLEAMRERKIGYRMWQNHGLVYAALIDEENYWKCYHTELPDFPSAVRWLHKQAAAVDHAFAEAWPVPE